MKYACITSMDKAYYDKYGKYMLESYKAFMKDITLFLYNEDFSVKLPRFIKPIGFDLGKDFLDFQDRWKGKNNRVVTFSKKAYSIIHAMEKIKADRLIWIDADCLLTRRLSGQFIELISNDKILSTHFGVLHKKDDKEYFSCETGFFILNTNHPGFEDFKDTYKRIYNNDIYHQLRRFYDGEVYGDVVRRMTNAGHEILDLNPGNVHKTPIPRSVLAPYISHMKAGLKDGFDYDSAMKKINDLDSDESELNL